MSKYIVDIHGDIEGDYEIIKKYEEQQPCDDAVSRQDVLDLVKKSVLISNKNYNSVCEAINKLPSAQPEIIRCRDCKHRTSYSGNCKLLEEKYHQTVRVSCDEFCSMAEM